MRHTLRRSRRIWILGVLGILATVLLLVPQPKGGRAQGAIFDLFHGPLFAVFATALARVNDRNPPSSVTRTHWMRTWGLLSLLGLMIEGIQPWVGRSFSWQDAAANSLGAASGILWVAGRAVRARILAILLLLMAMAPAAVVLADMAHQHLQMPVLASFESPWEPFRWSHKDCQVRRVRRHATHGQWSLQVDCEPARYPSLSLSHVPANWTSYEFLHLDITLDSHEPAKIVVKIHDKAHNGDPDDRFHYRAVLNPGLNPIKISLSDVQISPHDRLMNLAQMQVVQLFAVRPETPIRIYLDDLRLTTSSE